MQVRLKHIAWDCNKEAQQGEADKQPTQCASLHRKMGTHITKVKSLTLDTWSREQVEVRPCLSSSRARLC